jgi:VWFA-related protein
MTRFLTLALACAAAIAVHAQEQKPGQPKFEARAELVLVDVTVISSNGEPVSGLTENDFKLTVNGQPRAVHTVQFVSSRAIAPAAETPRLANVSSNDAPSTGRLLLFVVDENYLRIGAARAVLRTAERVMSGLAPGDLVGVARLPTGRGGVDFTMNRERVRTALSGVLGAQPSVRTDRVRLVEAHAQEIGDRNTWEQVLQRECGSGFENRSSDAAGTRESCVIEVEAQAKAVLSEARARSRVSINAFELLAQRLAAAKAPVNVVVISEGLYLGRDGLGELSQFSRLAATGRLTFHVVQPDQSMFDATDGPRTVGSSFSEAVLDEGLQQIAGMTRGSYFKVATAGGGAFDRIARELSGYYLLSFEPTEGDRTSRDRRIKVEVDRRGLTVKARSTYALDTSDTRDAASLPPEEQIKGLLAAPLPSAGLPMRVATYAVTSPEANRVRVVVAAEIGDAASNAVDWPVGVLVINADNKVVVDSTRYMALEPITSREPSPRMVTMTMVLDPGEYTLRMAAVDHDGKSGSVHHTFDARLHRVGGDSVRSSDLMISPDLGDGAVPRPIPTAVHRSETMYSILELTGDLGRVGKSRVTLQIADSATSPALVSVDAQLLRAAQGQGHRSFAAVLKLGVLPPGEYVARAVVKVPGQPDAVVARPFRHDPVASANDSPVPAAPRSVDDAPAPLPAAKIAAPVAKFVVEDVLKPDVVRPFLEYLQREHPVPPEHAAVVQQALAGTYVNVPAEKSPGSDDVTLAFIRGLAQLQNKQLAQAAGWFQVALRSASDFLGAAFFLGAVHAASGRDIDAIGAWQMATIGDDSQAVYPLLVDAQLRVGDAQAALDTIADAPEAWPSEDERLKRAATAQAMLGQFGPALESVAGLLQRHPTDQSLLFVAIQVLYRQHTARPLSSPDRARFDDYSRRYLDAKGPEAALVQTWRRYVMR